MKRRGYWWTETDPEIPPRIWFERIRREVAATKSYLERKKELTKRDTAPTVKTT